MPLYPVASNFRVTVLYDWLKGQTTLTAQLFQLLLQSLGLVLTVSLTQVLD